MNDQLTDFIINQLSPFEQELNEKIESILNEIQTISEKYTDALEDSNLSFYEGKDYRKDIAALKYLKDDLNNVISTYNSIIAH